MRALWPHGERGKLGCFPSYPKYPQSRLPAKEGSVPEKGPVTIFRTGSGLAMDGGQEPVLDAAVG
jgi:hypothetical protein